MSLKKILILPVGFILIHVLYIGCCKCAEGNFHREISSTRASHYSSLPNTSLDTVYINDTLTSIIQLNFNYVAKGKPNPFNALVNSAYATSCSCDNFSDSGYKYRIDSIAITSNNTFNGAAAGSNLTPFFKGILQCNTSNTVSLVYVPVNQMLDSFFRCRYYDNLQIICPIAPVANKTHTLKYSLYSNGKIFETTARRIVKWQ
jgi:hypothetical protein